MNRPSAMSGNWSWRYNSDALHPDFATSLSALMEMTDRDGYEEPAKGAEAGKPTEEAHERAELGSTV